jgi:hypothetical protein
VVSIAERNSKNVTIADGLKAGDRVATDELDALADGMTVSVVDDVG